MAIQIHIRVKDTDWEQEQELAQMIADEIDTFTSKHHINVPVLIIPVEDPENEMETLLKDPRHEHRKAYNPDLHESDDESKYLEAKDRADKAEQTSW